MFDPVLLVLRALAEGKIRWGFWPPGTDLSLVEGNILEEDKKGNGIWIRSSEGLVSQDYDWDNESDYESDDGREDKNTRGDESEEDVLHDDEEVEGDEEEDEEDSEEERPSVTTTGRFGALSFDEDSD